MGPGAIGLRSQNPALKREEGEKRYQCLLIAALAAILFVPVTSITSLGKGKVPLLRFAGQSQLHY